MAGTFNNFDLQFFDDTGVNVLNGGKIYVYVAGTSTPVSTYPTLADAQAQTNANPNPVVLDSAGRPDNGGAIGIFGDGNTPLYKLVIKDSDDTTIRTYDNQSIQSGFDPDSAAYDSKSLKLDDGDGMYDANGNEVAVVSATTSAVNHLQFKNAATGGRPQINAIGDDTNINLLLQAKGTGYIGLGNMLFTSDQTIGAGQDNYVLTYDNGTGEISLEESSGSGGLQSIQVFTSGGTWTKPAGINSVLVFVQGAGGGGAGAASSVSCSGGGSGGCAIEFIDVTGTSSETVTVGSGGAAGASGGNNGSGGGTSSFGAFCSATGGGGGFTNGTSGSGGTASGGDVNLTGNASPFWATGTGGGGGGGASPNFGGAGKGQVGAGQAGSYGGGGGGGYNNTAGGAGGDGLVVVYEYA